MKRFFVFTLILLFAAAGIAWFAIAESDSDSDEETRSVLDGDGEGYVGVTAWYDGTYAKSVHQVSLYNYGNVPIRYYYDFSLNISGPEDIPALERNEKGWVAPDNSIYDSQNYSVRMAERKGGRYSVSASSSLSVKVDINNDGIFDNFDGLNASASFSFTNP